MQRLAVIRGLTVSVIAAIGAITGSACASAVPEAESRQSVEPRAAAPAQRPTLVVFITVDQMRPDYFARFESQLTGGFARLYAEGAVFTKAFQDHAITETAPGHASTMSGRFPKSTGILENVAGVPDPASPLLDTDGEGASPIRFRGTALIDWMIAADARTRALSISRKDRGAILPVGRGKQHEVYWYAPLSGIFTTSTWYRDTLPSWVHRFNARRLPQRLAGTAWTLLLPPGQYAEPDSVPVEGLGRDYTFPHHLPADTAVAGAILANYPMMDEITLAMALDGVRELNLGRGPQADLLAVSLSSTDAIGHRYGPDSRELHDQILRLDRYLETFIDSLYAMRDSSRIVFALTSDHGVGPLPGTRSRDPNRRGTFVPVWDTVRAFRARVRAAGVDTSGFAFDAPYLLVRRDRFAAARVNADSVIDAFARALRAVPGVMRVESLAASARRDTTKDAIARRWLHMFQPNFPVALTVTLEPYSYWEGSTYPTHGTPHDYDAQVPLIFYGPPFQAGRYDEFARVVDMAPTLAEALGVRPLEALDGHVLRRAFR
ncbi:MAG: alkaline phosphatase family protein [Gemmatimonadaceae bacterium]